MQPKGGNEVPNIAEVINVRNTEDALKIQAKIQSLVKIPEEHTLLTASSFDENCVILIIALDIAYSTKSELAIASGIVWNLNEGKVIYEKVLRGQVSFPYHAGLLAFREVPLLINVINDVLIFIESMRQNETKEVKVILLCDGAGIAHPRLCGIACHLGVLLKMPSIGVAKNHLAGDYNQDHLLSQRGSYLDLKMQEKTIGSVLRSQTSIRPIFVSPGHLISISKARDIVLKLCHKYRLPEPIRRADHRGRIELRRIELEQECTGSI